MTKSFILVFTAIIDFSNDTVNEVNFKWSSEQGKMLSDAPTELNFTIGELINDCTYALPILAHFFERFSNNQELVTATASIKFEGENEDWQLTFLVPKETEENQYIRVLLFRLLTDKKEFLREVKALEKKTR